MSAESSPLLGEPASAVQAHRVGRYALYGDFASGGMATVHFGRLLGPVGFSRTVAIKRLHPQFARDGEFVSMFVDEARMAARIRHPNVVQTLDVVQAQGELLLVMEYVHGESMNALLKKALSGNERMPPAIAVGIVHQALFGLHAAHEAKSEHGEPLDLVHRDMSPHNVLVGADGSARVLDFGIAKAGGRGQEVTRDGQMKGKLSYFPPEQLTHEHAVDRRADVYASAATLWEALTGRRMIQGQNEFQRMAAICKGEIVPPSQLAAVPPALDAVVMKGLARAPGDRYATAREMALALEAAIAPASARAISDWVEAVAGESLRNRAEQISALERHSAVAVSPDDDITIDGGPISAILGRDSAGRISGIPQLRSSRPSYPSWRPGTTPPGGSAAPPEIEVDIDEPPPRRRRAAWVVVLLLLIAGAGGGMVVTGYGDMLRASRAGTPGGAGAAPTATIAQVPIDPGLPAAAAMAAAAPMKAADTASAASTATAPAPKRAGRPAWAGGDRGPRGADAPGTDARDPAVASPSAPTPGRATPAAPASASADCDVPFTIDPQGIRHPKLECL